MSSWYFCSNEIVNSPSRSDGIEITAECRYRREGARFIMDVGNRMNLRYETVATGIVFYHRFYMMHSFKTINRLIGAAACLYLAGKAEETPKKCRDLVKAVRTILSERQMEAFGDDPKEEIISHERLLLQTIKFDLCVQHPYKYIVKFAKNLKDDRAQIEKVVQMAWNFVNDSLSTTLCLQWKPQVVAVSLLHLAAKLSKYNLSAAPDGPHYDHSKSWWQHFLPEINSDVLEDICLQMLDFYDKTDVGASNYNMISPPKITMKVPQSIPYRTL
ncbi:uncharacterized protein TRIADDRAFT_27302 [Trichoplax adhaerens]|uniref:Cyclin-like domain-containing protein n=1 Tax=Trichoplax adhaerens TaxID=10228 RepID=B3RYS9_TRIAD|nr:hypothetical protein TRIADDRAFT_27302 [Trichoplax adhaerens]EDV24080.1 hypothetical protein TRIADDRAFT_27302 [Trichoplax adhaerens]|eukprot:XP_002113606.1 hypothetical protein TRIADDRAFT_27302 [Trichoplax adhaerens]